MGMLSLLQHDVSCGALSDTAPLSSDGKSLAKVPQSTADFYKQDSLAVDYGLFR